MLDDLIDDEARRLTVGSPRGDFKARVLSTVARPGRVSHVDWGWRRIALASLVSAAAILLALYVRSGSERTPSPSYMAETARPRPESPTSVPSGQAAVSRSNITLELREPRVVEPLPMPPLEFASSLEPIRPSPIIVERITASAMPPLYPIFVDELSVALLEVRAFDAPVEDRP